MLPAMFRSWLTCVSSDEYYRMKLQWKSISEEQERRNSRLRDYRSLIGGGDTLVLPFHSRERQNGLMIQVVFAEKDVNRTDRTTCFYEGVDNPHLGLLQDVLMTYCMYDFDLGETPPFPTHQTLVGAPFLSPAGRPIVSVPPLSCVCPLSGYVQGMSDLLSPILFVMDNEVDAFWCFVSFMDQMVSSGAAVGSSRWGV